MSQSQEKLGVIFGVLLLFLVLSSMIVLADTQYNQSGSLSTSGTTILYATILPNTSFVLNTSFNLYVSKVSIAGIGTVIFYYNDSTTNVTAYTTSSLVPIRYTVNNPYPGKLVDQISYTVSRDPAQYVATLDGIDFWTREPTYNLTISLNNSVNGSLIGGFCAVFSMASNVSCSIGNGTSIVSWSSQGWGGANRSNNFATLLNSQTLSGNVTRFATIGQSYCGVPPWYSASNVCGPSNFNSGCGISGTSLNYYCIVTDELSQRALSVSMTNNASEETEALSYFNTIQLMNASAGGYGTLTEWTSPFDNRTGTPIISKNYTNDNAADSDARHIIALFNNYNNPYFTNTTFKNAARTYARQMCLDFVHYNYRQVNRISNSNSSRNITYWPGSGGDAASTNIGHVAYMYSGYYGDFALALLACGVDTGNTTYFTIAQDTVENLLAAANWTPSTGFRTPPGRAFNWTNGATPTAVCNIICSPAPYLDDPDGKRMAKICGAERLYREAGLTLHPNIRQYCSDWYALVNATYYAKEWYTNGTRKSSLVQDYDADALATYLDMSQNSSNIGLRMNITGGKFVSGTQTFDSAACQGLYNPSFPVEVAGYLSSEASLITFGASGTNSCSGAGSAVAYTTGGMSMVLTQPVNNSNITNNYAYLSVTVYNNNVSTNTTVGTLPQILYNSTFATDPTLVGWSLGSWSYNSGGQLMNNSVDSGGSMHTQNLSFAQLPNGYQIKYTQNCPLNSTSAKVYYGTDSSSDSGDRILSCDRPSGGGGAGIILLKHDGGSFSSISCSQALCNVTIAVNLSANTVNVSNGTASWQDTIANSHSNLSYVSFVPGQNMTGGWNITDINVTNTGNAYNISTGGSALMNITIYQSTGVVLNQSNLSVNGTTLVYNWTGLSGTKNWYVEAWSQSERRAFGNFTFTIYNAGQNYSYCTAGNTIMHNVTGVYNITIYNITGGQSSPSYLNATYLNYNFSMSNGSYWATLVLNTSQSLLNISAYRLFLNTIISTFNITNNLLSNSTNNSTLFMPANNGTNNLLIDVLGNYSINVTCTVSAPLITQACNATGIYDNLFVVGAKNGNVTVTNFTVNVSNTSLGGLLYSSSTSNGTISFPLLQGYAYFFTINSSQYASGNSTNATDASRNYYNFSLYQVNTFELHFYNESTNLPINNTNITVQLISDLFSGNYTTGNGTLFIGLLTPGDYQITYWLDPSVPRNYYVTLTPQSFANLSLYIVDAGISTVYLPVVYNEYTRPIGGATVSLLRAFIENNVYVYKVVEMAKTDTNGQAVLRVVPNYITYKLLISSGNASTTTAPTKFIASTNAYTLSFTQNALTSIIGMPNVQQSLTFNNATNTYVFTWNDNQNLVTQGCMIVNEYNTTGITEVYNTCSDGSTGSIIYTITKTNNTRYAATASISTNTQYSTYSFGPLTADFSNTATTIFGLTGLIILSIILVTVGFVANEAGNDVMIITTVIGMVLLGVVGVVFYRWESIIGIIILGIIFIYKTNR